MKKSREQRDKVLRTGSCAAPVLDRAVLKPIAAAGSGPGDSGRLRMRREADSDTEIVSVPVLPAAGHLGIRAVRAAAGELLAAGCIPEVFSPVILLPEGTMESVLREIAQETGAAARGEEMMITGVRAEVTAAVTRPLVIGTAAGRRLFAPQRPVPDSSGILFVGYAGAEAAWLIASARREELETRFPVSMTGRCLALEETLRVREAALTAWEEGCSGLTAVSAGGVYAALYAMKEKCRCGFTVDIKEIPVLQEAVEIADYYDFDPLAAASAGCLLAVTEDAAGLAEKLRAKGINAAVIGRTEEGNAGILRNRDEIRYLDLPPADAVLKVLC